MKASRMLFNRVQSPTVKFDTIFKGRQKINEMEGNNNNNKINDVEMCQTVHSESV